jgi:hypothetical protein
MKLTVKKVGVPLLSDSSNLLVSILPAFLSLRYILLEQVVLVPFGESSLQTGSSPHLTCLLFHWKDQNKKEK